MSGLELANLLKESLTQVPMILVTAQSTGLASESETLVRDVIIKPYTKERVIDVINQQLSFDFKKLWKKDDLKGLERRNRLLRIASQEFQEAAESLSKLGDSPLDDWVRDRRHRMTTALSLFQLERLEAALDHQDGDWVLWKQELISSFQEAAIILDQSHKGSQDFFQ
jgi:CheY-like chemotaxis protein